MKKISVFALILFIAILIVPVAAMNHRKDAVSEIDNRALATLPSWKTPDKSAALENYVNDRIGFRDEMILVYTVGNDRIFHKMMHPIYTYGKDGYVFAAGITTDREFGEYEAAFVQMVKQMQDFCEERGIGFLFVFEPAKPAVLTEYLADGINYDRSWVDELFAALDAEGIHYVDNTMTLRERTLAGEAVFNQKYDANHWNDLGAFYGTNAILEELHRDYPMIHVNQMADYTVTQELQSSLPVSHFPITEYVPLFLPNNTYRDETHLFSEEIRLDPDFRTFGYYINEKRLAEGAPSELVFQGSYMNEYGVKYLANAFGEYAQVHDYQNAMHLDYYCNIFQPNCVVFEVAEYTMTDVYFDAADMNSLHFNESYERALKEADSFETRSLAEESIVIEKGNTLTTLIWEQTDNVADTWLIVGEKVFDMEKTDAGYSVTLLTDETDHEKIILATLKKGTLVTYR